MKKFIFTLALLGVNFLMFGQDQNVNGNLNVAGTIVSSKLSLDDPNDTDNWNSIWQSGFIESNGALNAPESSGWFWGINFNHRSNSATYKYGGQIAIKNSYVDPTMYFRSTTSDGSGIWTKVIHSTGNQTINGNVDINGKIHTKEVKVDLSGWSDFVFEETYKLPTLEEVEIHIKEKGHLKDIPSAKDVAKNGIYLGEMDSKLLQKIEELTLYIIKQQKQFNGQSIKLEKLAEENRELKIIISRLKNVEKRLNELEKK